VVWSKQVKFQRKENEEMNSNISVNIPVVVVLAIIALILLLPMSKQDNVRAKGASDEGQSVPATGSIK